MRTRALPRAIARLCLAALILNLFAPIAWATVLPPERQAAICQTPGDDGAPAHPAHSDQTDRAAHCPLCVLFGGTAWAPSAGVSFIPLAPTSIAATPGPVAHATPALPTTLRPSPRAPPALI